MNCYWCKKGKIWGHRVSHAKNRVNRVFKPNLQVRRIKGEDGKKMKVLLCTKCVRKLRIMRRDEMNKTNKKNKKNEKTEKVIESKEVQA